MPTTSMWTGGQRYGVFVFANENWVILHPEEYYYTNSFLGAFFKYIKWNWKYKNRTIVFEHSKR